MSKSTRSYNPDMVIELLSSEEDEVASSSTDGEIDIESKKPSRNGRNDQNNGSTPEVKPKSNKSVIETYKGSKKHQSTLDSFNSSKSVRSPENIVESESDDDEQDEQDEEEVIPAKKDRKINKSDSDNNNDSYDHGDSSVIEIDEESEEEHEESASDGGISEEDEEQPNEDGDEDEDEDDSDIQVPDSSPHKKRTDKYSSNLDSSPPAKITTKIPSLRERFSFDAKQLNVKPNGISSDYLELRRSFPALPANVIMSALRSEKTIRNAMRYLKTINSTESRHSSQESLSKTSSRLESLHSNRANLILSSPLRIKKISRRPEFMSAKEAKLLRDERLKEKAKLIKQKQKQQFEYERALARKKAEKENIVSSKVQMDFGKKSLRDRYITDRLSKHKAAYKEGDDNDSDEENSLVELVNSDDSLEEVPIAPTKRTSKRRYEDDDDDYELTLTRSRKRVDKSGSKSKKDNRSERAGRRANEIQDDDFMLPEFETDEDANLNVNQKIIKLFNNADIRDIIDLSNMKPEQAAILISKRPFRSIKDILKVDLSMGKGSVRNNKTPIERFVDVTGQKLTAYSAIDTLLKQCFDYSKSITSEIRKWGVNLKGKNLDGELAITNVDIESADEVSESESTSSSDSDADSDVSIVQKKYKKFKIDGSENDDDFSNSSRRKNYKSKIDNSKVKDRVGYFKKKPSLLSDAITLKDYQQVGINWINLLFQKQLSCILADEMGLGKTAQVISFLSHLKKKKYKSPHLIIVPSSTLENWLREFEKFSPILKVIPYYGSLDEREELRSVIYEDNDYDVVLTTYNLATGKIDAPFLQSVDFNVIVYDEGHMLKNATSDRYKKLIRLKANFRLLLTGTPLQNNLKELISLLNFILPEIFDSKIPKLELLFDQRATTKTENDKIEGKTYNPLMSEQAISKAKVMMSPFVLRRTKAQVMKSLPQKHTRIEYCELVPSQYKLYQEELEVVEEIRAEKARRKLMKTEEVRKLPPLSRKNTNILMTLRRACLHPLLFRRLYTDQMLKVMSKLIMKNPAYKNANQQFIYEDMQVMSDFELTQLCHTFPNELGKFVLKQNIYIESGKAKKLVEMLTNIITKGEKVLIFSLFTQMLDILEKILSLYNWKFLRLDGATAVDTRQTIIDKFYEDQTIPIMLLSTKAGGFGINLVCASHVIIHDQSLNPHDDRQAEDRAHRVGQTKEVEVTRLIVKDSIEENILQMAFNKLQLDNSMMTQNVEDVLLKTVEDLIANKREGKKKEEKSAIESGENTAEPEESAFEAFETPLTLEMVAENDDEPVEVKLESIKDSNDVNFTGKRTRRRKKDVNYYDGPNVPVEFLINDDEEDVEEQKKVDRYNKNQKKDKEFKPISSVETTPIKSEIAPLAEPLLPSEKKVPPDQSLHFPHKEIPLDEPPIPSNETVQLNDVTVLLNDENPQINDTGPSSNNKFNTNEKSEELERKVQEVLVDSENNNKGVESVPQLINQLTNGDYKSVKSATNVNYVDEYLKEINKVPKGIENDPLKAQIYHQQAEVKIIELQNRLRTDLMKKIVSKQPEVIVEVKVDGNPHAAGQVSSAVNNDTSKLASEAINISKSEDEKKTSDPSKGGDASRAITSITDIINNYPK